jgi:hypothetical protein
VRLDAVEKLLQQGLGRAREAAEPPAPRLPENAADVEKLSWADLNRVFALAYADKLGEVARRGGHEALRAKLAGLSQGERGILREALAESAA